ncbi:hypothetical protein [Streptomyces sp. SID12488]|uniref:hypothetical protein n=1 Tax=Streptomyces sp. SID12488 TaxID=2706040 RepID=UPI0013D93926|nr:hypothetical protein [Streptomyces sp. SID12488]NEA62317.1 hypothetical protein [Streptomyces sp. SID12488]
MNWPAALFAAVLRVTRTAAGRRALRVAVLVGGLFGFGFLCGERAHAAEDAPLVRVDVVRPVDERAGPPVGGLVEAMTEKSAEAPTEVSAQTQTSPALPTLPEVLALPVLPVLPELTELSALPGIPEPLVLPGVPAAPAAESAVPSRVGTAMGMTSR